MLAAALVLLPAVPALAGYGAIAWDKESGKRGWSWNEAIRKRPPMWRSANAAPAAARSSCAPARGPAPRWPRRRTASSSALPRARAKIRRGSRLSPIARRQGRRLRRPDQRLQQVKPVRGGAIAPPPGSAAHKAFDLAFGPGDRVVCRFAGLGVLGDQLHDRRLRPHQGPDLQRRRIADEVGDRRIRGG